jgi:HSP20 family protein
MSISVSFCIMSCAAMLSLFVGRSSALFSKGIVLRTVSSRGQTFASRGQLGMTGRSDLSKQQNQFLMRPMDDMLNNVMRLAFRPLLESSPSGSLSLGALPAIDVVETPKEYIIHADLPGFDKDDVEVSMTDRSITITATREEQSSDISGGGKETFIHLKERVFGESFTRVLGLPDDVDKAHVKTQMDHGLLTIHLTKIVVPASEESKVRKLPISSKARKA